MIYLQQWKIFNWVIFFIMTALYAYQGIFTYIGYRHRKVAPLPEPRKMRRFALCISARNESKVIGELIDSLQEQKYPHELMDIYVVADNCTDNTAEVAREHGAIAFERFNQEEKGKGFALNYLYQQIIERTSVDYYDVFGVFDADNIVDENFVAEMNKSYDAYPEKDAFTCYRNSKNYSSTWVSAAYSLWFLREARFANQPRMMKGSQCMISGTGWTVKNEVLKAQGGWLYHLLTEDIQFSTASVLNDVAIGYCDGAIVYDEQPTTFKASWTQRLRWSKGFYQIDAKYTWDLIKGIFTGKHNRFGCYDVLMTILPASILTVSILFIDVWLILAAFKMPYYVSLVFRRECMWLIVGCFVNMILGLYLYGYLIVKSEWDKIPAKDSEKWKGVIGLPLFILSYMPISIHALVSKVDWKPIEHHTSEQLSES